MRIVMDDLWFCVDCTMIAANGDATGIDSEERVAECEAGLASLGAHVVADGPREDETEEADRQEFSWSSCDCCGSGLGGERVRFAVLAPD